MGLKCIAKEEALIMLLSNYSQGNGLLLLFWLLSLLFLLFKFYTISELLQAEPDDT